MDNDYLTHLAEHYVDEPTLRGTKTENRPNMEPSEEAVRTAFLAASKSQHWNATSCHEPDPCYICNKYGAPVLEDVQFQSTTMKLPVIALATAQVNAWSHILNLTQDLIVNSMAHKWPAKLELLIQQF